MGSGKDITIEKKIAVKTLLETENISQQDIANKVGVSRSTVRNIAKLLKEGKNLSAARPSRAGTSERPRNEKTAKLKTLLYKTERNPYTSLERRLEDQVFTYRTEQ